MVASGAAAVGLVLVAGCDVAPTSSSSTSPPSSASPSSQSSTSTPQSPAPSTVTSTVTQPSASSSAAPADFADDYAREHDGVVRIVGSTCDGTTEGSGFLVAPDLAATAAHVVAGQTALSITDPVTGDQVTGQVAGFDAARDVALVRLGSPLSGHVFAFAAGAPRVGSRIAAIGYPLNGPEALSQGAVSGLDRTITVRDGPTLSGLIQTDAPLNPGDSGGPMIAPDGTVEGIADAAANDAQGIDFAVPAEQAAPLIDGWRHSPATVPAATCASPAPAPQTPAPPATSPVPTAPSATSPAPTAPASPSSTAIDDAVATLIHYIALINDQDYADAYATLTPAGQGRAGSEDVWARGISGSRYDNPQVVTFSDLPGGGFDVELTFTSTQPGQTCKNWDLDYHLVPAAGGGYLIDVALPHDGGSGFTPC